jgi:GntR family transcriptional regulator
VVAVPEHRTSEADQQSFAALATELVARGRALGMEDSVILDVVTGLLQQHDGPTSG